MKILYLLLGLFFLPVSLPAQIGLYGMFDASHLNGQTSVGTQSASSWLYGPTLGVFYTPLHFGPLAAGLDLRGSFASGSSRHFRDGLVGIRVAGKAPLLPLRPYVEGLVGAGGTRTDSTGSLATHYTTKFQYDVLGGLDCTVLPLIDLRVIEVGYGHITGISSGSTADPTNLFHVGAGIVIRLP